MRKREIILLLILNLYFLFSSILTSINLYVGPDQQYSTFESAFDNAQTGDYIIICETSVTKICEFPDYGTNHGWKWLCFDILDITMTGGNNTVDPLLNPIQDDLIQGLGQSVLFYYDDPNWIGGDHEITSPQGYKFQTENECEFDISGFRCGQYTTFPVLAEMLEGNWIGYFLGKSQHVYDAFDGYLDNIFSIQAQHWSVKYHNGWPDVPYTLNPGDMVVVWCEHDILDFSWLNGTPREAFNIEKTQNFTYLEEADYIPIYMQLDPENMPTEIGAFVDGECQGATVVQDTLAQICAYILENQGQNLEFEFYYGGRSENKIIREYNIYDPETIRTEKGSILIENNRDCYYVSFKNETESTPGPVKLEASNYPNPFNPVTTIAYCLPEECQISISIFNIKGQEVKELTSGIQPAGNYTITWNGKDESGKDVTSGIYFYKLKNNGKELTRKMLMLK
ncbi:MAG: T9SS type A sorting domain-containing protein [Armatimonadetes bacterium]|nr:T9SS type A sorting domain-containing protein [Armatimonadota bacterium]